MTRSAWLSGLLTGNSYHDPQSYPKSADELIGRKREPEPMTKDQWRALFSHLTR